MTNWGLNVSDIMPAKPEFLDFFVTLAKSAFRAVCRFGHFYVSHFGGAGVGRVGGGHSVRLLPPPPN